MLTMNQAVQQIVAAPAPVLFPDTCALLDLIRLPYRGTNPQVVRRTLDAVQELLAMQDNSRLWVVIPQQVEMEWNRNEGEVINELTNHWIRLDQNNDIASEIASKAGLNTVSAMPYTQTTLNQYLQLQSRTFLDRCILIKQDEKCANKALLRTLNEVPPAQKGKGAGDCVIIEHCLEIMRKLRQLNYQENCVFMTTNTNDYCENRSTPKAPLDAELQTLNVILTTSWEWTKAQLTPRL